ncbi:transposase [candidate division WOR-3 bacterium]|nr:transposase [candidate division WOR-3 bacterium]
MKLWFYAYANGIRSSRKLAKLLEENIAYMYLFSSSGYLDPPQKRISVLIVVLTIFHR